MDTGERFLQPWIMRREDPAVDQVALLVHAMADAAVPHGEARPLLAVPWTMPALVHALDRCSLTGRAAATRKARKTRGLKSIRQPACQRSQHKPHASNDAILQRSKFLLTTGTIAPYNANCALQQTGRIWSLEPDRKQNPSVSFPAIHFLDGPTQPKGIVLCTTLPNHLLN
jgi:hypothetical protein